MLCLLIALVVSVIFGGCDLTDYDGCPGMSRFHQQMVSKLFVEFLGYHNKESSPVKLQELCSELMRVPQRNITVHLAFVTQEYYSRPDDYECGVVDHETLRKFRGASIEEYNKLHENGKSAVHYAVASMMLTACLELRGNRTVDQIFGDIPLEREYEHNEMSASQRRMVREFFDNFMKSPSHVPAVCTELLRIQHRNIMGRLSWEVESYYNDSRDLPNYVAIFRGVPAIYYQQLGKTTKLAVNYAVAAMMLNKCTDNVSGGSMIQSA